MNLARIQDAFQSALLDGGDGIMKSIPDGPRESKDVLFGVYRNGYVFRLADILAEDFARLHTYIGDEAFFTLARGYIFAHPSRSASARDYSRGFPGYVSAQALARETPLVSAIVRLEGLLNDIFDCSDAAPLALGDLAAFAPEDFGRLSFTSHPSVRRLDGPAGMAAAFTALSNNEPPPAPPDGAAQDRVLVWRHDVLPLYRTLNDEEAMMWDEAAKGVRFDTLCALLATYDASGTAAVRAAQYLHGWIVNGQLTGARLT